MGRECILPARERFGHRAANVDQGGVSETTKQRGSPARRRVRDLIAGASVGVVLIPQSMAYAELAGMPPVQGLYAAALPPLAAAFFASSPYLQTGPTALTSLLTFGALSTLATPASPEYVALGALLALVVGVVRVVIGRLRAGAIAYLMSMPVLRGFTAAAAMLIFASQVPAVLGIASNADSVLARAVDAFRRVSEWSPTAIAISGATVAMLLGGRRSTRSSPAFWWPLPAASSSS